MNINIQLRNHWT